MVADSLARTSEPFLVSMWWMYFFSSLSFCFRIWEMPSSFLRRPAISPAETLDLGITAASACRTLAAGRKISDFPLYICRSSPIVVKISSTPASPEARFESASTMFSRVARTLLR